MGMLVLLAWRNIWRNRRRTLITILAVGFAALFSIVQRGIDVGNDEANNVWILGMFTGQMQVQRAGYNDAPSLQKSFRCDTALLRAIGSVPGVRAQAPRLMSDGLVARGEKSLGAMLCGVDPPAERRVSTLLSKIRQGRAFAPDAAEGVVGYKLLANLGAAVGDTVILLTQSFDGSLANMKFRVCGALKTGMAEFDAAAVILDLGVAQELLGMPGRVTAVTILPASYRMAPEVRGEVARALPDTGLAAVGWEEILPDLKQGAELNEIGGKLFLGLLILVVAFGILNTVLMSVTERFREFGILLAVGMRNGQLALIVVVESIIILLIGMAIGSAAGAAIASWIEAHPIPLGGTLAAMVEQYDYQPVITATARADLILGIDAMIILITLAAMAYPVHRVLRLEPLKGIRHT